MPVGGHHPTVLDVLAHLRHGISLARLDLHQPAEHAEHSRRKVTEEAGRSGALSLLPVDKFIEDGIGDVGLVPGILGGEQCHQHDGQLPHVTACLDAVAFQEDCLPDFRWTGGQRLDALFYCEK